MRFASPRFELDWGRGGIASLALAVLGMGGCSLLSLDDLQAGSTTGFGSSTTSGATESATSTSSASSSSSSGSGGAGGAPLTTTGTTTVASSSDASSSSGMSMTGDAAYVAAIQADGPIAWYRMAEGSALDPAVDLVGGRNGVYADSLTVGVAPPFANTSDTAVRFVSGAMVADYPELGSLDAPHSLEAWVLAESVDNTHRGIIDIEWDDPPAKQGYRMYVYTSFGVPKLVYGRTTATTDQDLVVNFPNDGMFHHVVGTYDGGMGVCVFIDGISTCANLPNITLTGAPTGLVVGRRTQTPSAAFKGTIDEVAIYDKALSQAQVVTHYDARSAP